MDDSDGPPELRRLSNTAAFCTAIAGIIAVCAGLQVGAFLIFRNAWARPLPWAVALVGAACVWAALQLIEPRRWIPAVAGALLGLLALGGFAWSRWLAANGFRSPLVLLLAPAAALAGILLAYSTRDILTVARLRREARAEFADLAGGSSDPAKPGSPSLTVVSGAVGLVACLIGLPLYAPERFAWVSNRVRGVLAGRGPLDDAFVAKPREYRYAGSPLEWYLDTEARYTRVPKQQVIEVADRIARNVSWKLAAETGRADPIEGERRLWEAGRQKELPLWIAAELRDIHAFYHEESLFSRSFDPDAHFLAEEIHMDCDQLVWMFLHVASRLDLAMGAVPSPRHVYLRYDGPAGQAPLYVETTQFRNVIVDRDQVDMLGPAIGETFFIDEAYYPSGKGGLLAAPELVAAAGLFQPWAEREIRDSMLGNVLLGVEEAGVDVDVIAEAEKQVAGSRDITLVANLYEHYLGRARKRAAAKDVEGARADATRARRLRAEHGSLVIRGEPIEEQILDDLGP